MISPNTKRAKSELRFGELFKNILGKDAEQLENETYTVSTGGGEPIPKGQKMTTEKRVLQPRDSKGRFAHNVIMGWRTKYGGRAKNTDIVTNLLMQHMEKVNAEELKAGQVLKNEKSRVILTIKLTKEELVEMVKNYINAEKGFEGEEYSTITKRGRQARVEKESEDGIVEGKVVSWRNTVSNLKKRMNESRRNRKKSTYSPEDVKYAPQATGHLREYR